MLNILWMIILIIILFLIILLIMGIRITFEYNKTGSEFEGCLKILILRKIKIYSTEFPSKDSTTDDGEKKEKDRNIKNIIELAKPCFKDLLNYLKTILNSIRINKIQNHFIIGMDSFADTGKYIGIIWGVLSIINPIDRNLKISAEPSFNGSRLDGRGTNEIEIRIINLIVPTVRLILNKDIRLLIRGVLDER